MAKLIYGLLCRRAIIDQFTNSVSQIDVVEMAHAPQIPFQLPAIHVSTLWEPETPSERRVEMQVQLVTDSGKVLATEVGEVVLGPEHIRARLIIGFEGAVITEKARHWFVLSSRRGEWQEAHRLPLDIALTKS